MNTHTAGQQRFQVAENENGRRLDSVLAARHPEVSRSRLQNWIRGGAVTVSVDASDVAVTSPAHRLVAGATLTLTPPSPGRAELIAAPTPPLAVLHEDEDIVVINKPAGVVMHPAPGNRSGTLSQALRARYGDEQMNLGGEIRGGVVHRLDKGTSGVVVAARTARAWRELTRAFAEHAPERRYLALVCGTPSPARAVVRGRMTRDPNARQRMTLTSGKGRESETRWRVRETLAGGGAALLEARPSSGRTHQIRVHLSACGHPVIGDDRYGGRRLQRDAEALLGYRSDRPLLHAWRLGFRHPADGAAMDFRVAPPADFVRALGALNGDVDSVTDSSEGGGR